MGVQLLIIAFAAILCVSKFKHTNNYTFTTAPLPPPTNLRAVSTTATSITLTWEQPKGADAVDRYEINYHYLIEECEFEGGGLFPSVTVTVSDGTLRRYTLNNSASTPVEEDSVFRVTLTAINNATRSVASQPAMTTTAEAGIHDSYNNYFVDNCTVSTPQPLG